MSSNTQTTPAAFKIAPLAEKKPWRMYRHSDSTDRNLVIADYTTARPNESSIQFLTRLEESADEHAKRVFGSILYTRCRNVSAFYTVVETDDEGFTTKRQVPVRSVSSSVPDMKIHKLFPQAIIKRVCADARFISEQRVVSITVCYHNCNPKPASPQTADIESSEPDQA